MMIISLWRNRHIALQLAWRDVSGRYRGSYLGFLWAFVVPLAMVAIFSFVFGTIFGARWTAIGIEADRTAFALPMFAGLLVHMFLAECATRAPIVVVSNANFVKRMVFPLEALCGASVIAALFHAAIGFVVLLGWLLVTGGGLTLHVLLLPAIWILLALAALGISLLLAALGVFLRDIAQVVGLVMTALLFLAPIMYPMSVIPQSYLWLAMLNPLTPFVEATRAVTVLGQAPEYWTWAAMAGIAVLALLAGDPFFSRARRAFADVL